MQGDDPMSVQVEMAGGPPEEDAQIMALSMAALLAPF